VTESETAKATRGGLETRTGKETVLIAPSRGAGSRQMKTCRRRAGLEIQVALRIVTWGTLTMVSAVLAAMLILAGSGTGTAEIMRGVVTINTETGTESEILKGKGTGNGRLVSVTGCRVRAKV